MNNNEDVARQYLEDMGLTEDEIEDLANKSIHSDIRKDFIPFEPESPPRIMVYDIETTPLKFWGFRCGKTRLTHSALDRAHYSYDIICITYCFNDGQTAKALNWGFGSESSQDMVNQFDRIIRAEQGKGTIIIGKNNKRFDDKHLNTHRWIHGHTAMPDWIKYTEDLETQLRRYFYLPSMSLDYVSELMGFGGKIKMELSHWTKIVNYKKAQILLNKMDSGILKSVSLDIFGQDLSYVLTEGKLALIDMIQYGCKDADDTMGIILDVCGHVSFKGSKPHYKGVLRCRDIKCGSFNLKLNGTRGSGGVKYQQFFCNDHYGYAGRARILPNGKFGKIT